MDSNEASKEWQAHKKYELGKATEKDKASSLDLEKGEVRRDGLFGSESLVHKDIGTGISKLSSSAQVAYFHELAGEFRGDAPFGSVSLVHKDMDIGITKLSSSGQVSVKRQSMSPERGTHREGTAKVDQSGFSSLGDESDNLRRPTSDRKNSEKHCQSSSHTFHISSKERHKRRKRNCFRYYEYHHVLEKIEKVCSKRLSKLVLLQNEDRKQFNVLQKKQELEFFREHVHSYKARYERVKPTVRYDRIKLPKLLFRSLSRIFHKHIQAQLIKFVKQQINDRDKEKRKKERWIFEASAGFLKIYFDDTPLTYSEFEISKPKCLVNDYSEGEPQLKYMDLQCLSSAIEAIASGNEVADSNSSKDIDVSDPIHENLQSPLIKNGGTKHGLLSIAAADEIVIIDGMSSQSNCACTAEFVEKVGTQVTCLQLQSPLKTKGTKHGLSVAAEDEIATIDSMPSQSNCASMEFVEKFGTQVTCSQLQSPLKTSGGTKHGLLVAAADEIATIDSMSSQFNCASGVEFVEKVGTQVTRSQPPENKGENLGKSCSSVDDMAGALEITKAMSADSGSTLPAPREKRRHTSAGGDASEGSCTRSERNLPHEFVNNIPETALNHEGPQAARLPSVNVNESEKSGNQRSKDIYGDKASSLAQVNDQRNINANFSTSTNSLTQLQHCDHTGQNATYPYQQSSKNTCSVRTGLYSPGTSNIQQQQTNQTMTGSTVEERTPEVRLQSDPTTIELNQVLMPCRDHTSSFSQATEQRNINACSSSLTQCATQHLCDQTCETVAHQYQPSGGSTTLLRAWLESPGELNIQRQSANQTTTNSTSEHVLESGLRSDPFTIELSRLLTLRDLMTKKHLFEKQKIILEQQRKVAELNKKYDHLFHNLEMETLQQKKDVHILQEKVCRQQMLAEAFQIAQASAEVVSCSQRGAPLSMINVPNQSSGQQTVWFPTAATINQPAQPVVRSSTHQLLQPGMITQDGAMNSSDRSAAALTSAPRGAPSRTIYVPNQSSSQQTVRFPTSATMNQPPVSCAIHTSAPSSP